MDLRNVVFAIALSFAVLFGWSVIFETPQEQKQSQQTEQHIDKKDQRLNDTPSVNIEGIGAKKVSRTDAINSSERIKFENNNIKGSISLKGGLIDDITFKKYNETIGSKKKVTYLNPLESDDGYFIETGWAASNLKKTSLPNTNTIWKPVGNQKLTEKNPITLEWNNNSGLIFRKKIELDDKFLFKVTQEIINKSAENIELYPYAQITRTQNPNVTDFYILHEGFIGVFDEDLEEVSYSDIEDRKKEFNAKDGWLGITDKYWMTALVPEKGKSFKGSYGFRKDIKKAIVTLVEGNTIDSSLEIK